MSKEELLKKCKYYNGEAKKPSGVDDWAWNAEKDYVERKADNDDFAPEIDWYKNCVGLLGYQANEKTPTELRALLWSRFSNFYNGGTDTANEDTIKDFVKKYDTLY